MNLLLKEEIASIINQIQRSDAPTYSGDEGDVIFEDTNETSFDIVDSKVDRHFIRPYQTGTASYINSSDRGPYDLRFICYDEYIHRFVYDDKKGNTHKSRLKDGMKVADYLVFDKSKDKVYFIVHELSGGSITNKRAHAKKQLSDTLNQLYKSKAIAKFIDCFSIKYCIISAKDHRKTVSTNGLAEGFEKIYKIIPEPVKFTFGQMKTFHFIGLETSIVNL